MAKKIAALILTAIMAVTVFPLSALTAGANPAVPESSSPEYYVGQIVEYGSYPQTLVEDASLIAELNSASAHWQEYDYYARPKTTVAPSTIPFFSITDVTYGAERYRGVRLLEYRYYGGWTAEYQTMYGYDCGYTYWFRYEPLRWRIIDADTGLALCEDIIDAKCCTYEGQENGVIVDYASSYIHDWLNRDFAEVAFTAEELAALAQINLTNTCSKRYDYYYNNELISSTDEIIHTDDTNDRIFLLSRDEVDYAESGFGIGTEDSSSIAFANATDYTKILGLESTWLGICNVNYDSYNSFAWMLRSGGRFTTDYVYYENGRTYQYTSNNPYTDVVMKNGAAPVIGTTGTSSFSADFEGVRPAIRFIGIGEHQHTANDYWERMSTATETQNGRDVRRCRICGEILEERPNYLLTLDPGEGGFFTDSAVAKYCFADGERYSSAIESIPVPQRAYSVFTGWFDEGSFIDLNLGVFNFSRSVTLNAGWSYEQSSGSCGASLSWNVDFANDTLTVSGTGDMYPYSYENPAPWNKFAPYIREIIIEDGVGSISTNAFTGFSSLRDLFIADSVTSMGDSILDIYPSGMAFICSAASVAGAYAQTNGIRRYNFTESGYCGDSKEYVWQFDFTAGLFSVTGRDAFIGTPTYADASYTNDYEQWSDFSDRVTSVSVGNGVTSVGNWFGSMENLKEAEIGEGVEVIGSAFFNDTALESVSIPSTLRAVWWYAFSNCKSLKNVYITDLSAWLGIDFEYVSGGWFIDHEYVGSVPNPLFYGADLYINGELATDIEIPYGVQKITQLTFEGCNSIQSVSIPGTVTLIESQAFNRCPHLSSVTFGEGIEEIREIAFGSCPALEEICLPDSLSKLNRYAFSDTGWENNQNDGAMYLGKFLIGYKGAQYCDNLVIDGHTEHIAESAFSSSVPIRSITIPGSIKDISGGCFSYVSGLESVEILDGTETIGENAFEGCRALTEITIPASVTQIADSAFPSGNGITVYCFRNSAADIFAQSKGMTCSYIDAPAVSVNGITVTVNNLYGVSDFFIASGECSSYREVKNSNIVRITPAKLNGSSEYTYVVPEPGTYTLWVRYSDTDREPARVVFTCSVTAPVFTENGKEIRISNLDGVRIIRTAYGTYDTVKEIKASAGSRSFSAALIAEGSKDGVYTILNTVEDGGTPVTVFIEYTNGYKELRHFTLHKKTPVCTPDGSSVTFSGLEDVAVMRYAPGIYSTAAEVKRAPGAVTLNVRKIVNGTYTIGPLSGTYTFLVQYDDNSQNIITLTF